MSAVNGLLSKVTSKADIIGLFAGWFSSPATSNLTNSIDEIRDAAENLRIGDGLNAVMQEAPQQIVEGIPYYALGWVAKEFDVPFLGKYGSAIEKGATHYVAGRIISTLIANMGSSRTTNSPAEATPYGEAGLL